MPESTRRRARIGAVALLAVVMGGPVAPASATGPTTLNEIFGANVYGMTVSGSYTPLIGGFDCVSEGAEAIVWYAPGSGADYLWYDLVRNLDTHTIGHLTNGLTVNGTFRPFVGDFDADGCDDIFWYAPGAAADYIWYSQVTGGFSSRSVSVSGEYVPMVGDFDADGNRDDVYWYSTTGGAESIWTFTSTRGIRTIRGAPQVSYSGYRPVAIDDVILFHRPDGTDYLWDGVAADAVAPDFSDPWTAAGDWQPFAVRETILLYGTGPLGDNALLGYAHGQTRQLLGGTIPGAPRVATSPTSGSVVLHGPGSAVDQLWIQPKTTGPASGPG